MVYGCQDKWDMQSQKPDTTYGHMKHLQGNNWNDGTTGIDAALQ